MEQLPFHAVTREEAACALHTDAVGGLASVEAARRLAADGPNRLWRPLGEWELTLVGVLAVVPFRAVECAEAIARTRASS